MDKTVQQQQIDEQDRVSVDDFAALFEQLECAASVAPVDAGIQKLLCSIEVLRRKDVLSRNH